MCRLLAWGVSSQNNYVDAQNVQNACCGCVCIWRMGDVVFLWFLLSLFIVGYGSQGLRYKMDVWTGNINREIILNGYGNAVLDVSISLHSSQYVYTTIYVVLVYQYIHFFYKEMPCSMVYITYLALSL